MQNAPALPHGDGLGDGLGDGGGAVKVYWYGSEQVYFKPSL